MKQFGVHNEFLRIAMPLERIAYGVAEDALPEHYYGYTVDEWERHFELHPENFSLDISAAALIESPSLWVVRIDALESMLRKRFLELPGTKFVPFACASLSTCSIMNYF